MTLNAGPIQLTYERGFLRTFLNNGDEVLRMIYFALRDSNWDTAHTTITAESIRSEADSFVVSYNWQVADLGIQMSGTVHIEGQSDGRVAFDFYGKANNAFLRNRVGICVLHPIENLAGQPCAIEHPDGRTTELRFPDLISPHQPFLNIQAMTWTMTSGQRFRSTFGGDVFETEDQRNWTDASYKTYSTPLERPFPVNVRAGTEIRQHVTFLPVSIRSATPMHTSSPTATHQQGRSVSTETGEGNAPIHVGLGHRADGLPMTSDEANRLKMLRLSHLRADVLLYQTDWQTRLAAAQQDASLLRIPLELALFFGSDAAVDVEEFVAFVQRHDPPIYTLLLFDTDTGRTTEALLNQIAPALRRQLSGVRLGGGTDGNFVELNRHPFDFSQVDFVTYSINPQVHAFDDQTLMENAAAQADTVRSARTLSGGKPVHISPVTLLPRYNPAATSGGLWGPPPVDPRQATAFAAEWTTKSIQALTQAGAASVTYFETHGPRGLLNGGKPYPVLDAFQPIR